jgi:hypothetical protein
MDPADSVRAPQDWFFSAYYPSMSAQDAHRERVDEQQHAQRPFQVPRTPQA